jgi:hypothetical protein
LPPARSNASPDCQSVHLLLRLGLAAHVAEIDAPLRVPGLVAADLRDAHQHHRAHEDEEVREEEEEHEHHLQPEPSVREQVADALKDVPAGEPPRVVRRVEEVVLEEDERDDRGEEDRDAVVEAPRPGAAAVDDVFLAEARVLGAEEARPRDEAPDHEIDETAEADDHEEGAEDRLAGAESLLLVEEEVRGRAREDGDEGRHPGQATQLRGEDDGFLARTQHAGRRHVGGRHGLSV